MRKTRGPIRRGSGKSSVGREDVHYRGSDHLHRTIFMHAPLIINHRWIKWKNHVRLAWRVDIIFDREYNRVQSPDRRGIRKPTAVQRTLQQTLIMGLVRGRIPIMNVTKHTSHQPINEITPPHLFSTSPKKKSTSPHTHTFPQQHRL